MRQPRRVSALTPNRRENRRVRLIAPVAFAAALLGGVAAASQPVFLLTPIIFVVPILLWKRPEWGVLAIAAAALTIEQFPYSIGAHAGAITSKIPFFRTPVHGLIISPGEMFILLALVIWIMHSGLRHSFGISRTPLALCMCVLWILIFVGMGIGMSHGARLKNALWELRPWMLLSATYLLAWTMLRRRRAIDALLWTLVLGTGFKAVQGTFMFFTFVRRMVPRPEAILAHEESYFFCLFVLITAALWLYGFKGSLRMTATALLPFVIIADLANARRLAWLLLIISLVVLLVVAYATLPVRRTILRRVFVVALMGSAVYLPAYWNGSGTLAQPARAIRSAIAPDARDQSSDLYRKQEDVNLLINIKASGKFGRGFGIPIVYAATITDISGSDSMIAFIPHNGLLWIWMRLGMQGEIALWCLIAAALIRACGLARSKDPKLAMFGAIVCCSIVAWVLIGYNDLGFALFRIAVVMGTLLGAMEAAIRFDETPAVPPDRFTIALGDDAGDDADQAAVDDTSVELVSAATDS